MNTNRKASLAAGVSILIMALAAAISFGYAHNTLVVSGDTFNTVSNLQNNFALLIVEIFGWLIILLCDILVSIALFVYLKNVNTPLAGIMATFRIIYSAVLAFAISNLVKIGNILNNTSSDISETIQIKVMNFLVAFEKSWSIGLIIFGVHLLLLGFLILKSYNIHKFWGLILIFAGISYFAIYTAKNFIPGAENLINIAEAILMAPMTFGEVGFAIWLIAKGKNPRIIYSNRSEKK